MKRFSGQRMGQSGTELATVIVLSCIIHILIVSGAVFLSWFAVPKKHIPVYYQVKLVAQPLEASRTRAGRTAAVPKQETVREKSVAPPVKPVPPPKPPPKPVKAEPKTVKSVPKPHKAEPKPVKTEPKVAKAQPPSKSAPKKSVKTETPQPEKTPPPEPVKTAKAPIPQPEPQPGEAPGGDATPGAKTEHVSITSTNQRFAAKYEWYTTLLLERIEQNWRPLQDVKDAKVRVVFTINRWGKILMVSIDDKETTGSPRLRRQAERHIWELHSFPPLPESFSRESVEFSVDMMAKK